jgi:hypothetical protein
MLYELCNCKGFVELPPNILYGYAIQLFRNCRPVALYDKMLGMCGAKYGLLYIIVNGHRIIL